MYGYGGMFGGGYGGGGMGYGMQQQRGMRGGYGGMPQGYGGMPQGFGGQGMFRSQPAWGQQQFQPQGFGQRSDGLDQNAINANPQGFQQWQQQRNQFNAQPQGFGQSPPPGTGGFSPPPMAQKPMQATGGFDPMPQAVGSPPGAFGKRMDLPGGDPLMQSQGGGWNGGGYTPQPGMTGIQNPGEAQGAPAGPSGNRGGYGGQQMTNLFDAPQTGGMHQYQPQQPPPQQFDPYKQFAMGQPSFSSGGMFGAPQQPQRPDMTRAMDTGMGGAPVAGFGGGPRTYGGQMTDLSMPSAANSSHHGFNAPAKAGGAPAGPMWDGFSQQQLTGASGQMGIDPAMMQQLGFNGLRASITQDMPGGNSEAAKFWVSGADGRDLGRLDMLGKTNGLDLRNLGAGAKINWSGLGSGGAMLGGNGRRY